MANPLNIKIDLATEAGDHGENAVRLRNAIQHAVDQFNVIANQVEAALAQQTREVIAELQKMYAQLNLHAEVVTGLASRFGEQHPAPEPAAEPPTSSAPPPDAPVDAPAAEWPTGTGFERPL